MRIGLFPITVKKADSSRVEQTRADSGSSYGPTPKPTYGERIQYNHTDFDQNSNFHLKPNPIFYSFPFVLFFFFFGLFSILLRSIELHTKYKHTAYPY